MSAVRAALAFVYDFLVGEDLLLFAVAAATVAVTAIVADRGDGDVWWLIPLGVAVGLSASILRAARRR